MVYSLTPDAGVAVWKAGLRKYYFYKNNDLCTFAPRVVHILSELEQIKV